MIHLLFISMIELRSVHILQYSNHKPPRLAIHSLTHPSYSTILLRSISQASSYLPPFLVRHTQLTLTHRLHVIHRPIPSSTLLPHTLALPIPSLLSHPLLSGDGERGKSGAGRDLDGGVDRV